MTYELFIRIQGLWGSKQGLGSSRQIHETVRANGGLRKEVSGRQVAAKGARCQESHRTSVKEAHAFVMYCNSPKKSLPNPYICLD